MELQMSVTGCMRSEYIRCFVVHRWRVGSTVEHEGRIGGGGVGGGGKRKGRYRLKIIIILYLT